MIKKITSAEYENLCKNAELLRKRAGRPAVFLSPDDKIIKLIYKTGMFSLSRSIRVWRMLRNSKKLSSLNIPSISIDQCFYYPAKRCYVIIYPKIPGIPVSQLMGDKKSHRIMQQLLAFIAGLHTKGVFLQDLHFNNILYRRNDDFAVIDIDLIDVYKSSLRLSKRIKNLCFPIVEEYLIVSNFGLDKFIKCYIEHSDLSQQNHTKFYRMLRQNLLKRITLLKYKVNKLSQIGIIAQAPDINDSMDLCYTTITGESVRDLLQKQEVTILEDLAKFFAYLHAQGVFVNCINFDAIIKQTNGKFALNDIQWVEKIQIKPLCLKDRMRSLSGIMRVESAAIEDSLGLRQFIGCYLDASKMSRRQSEKFLGLLQKKLQKRGSITF